MEIYKSADHLLRSRSMEYIECESLPNVGYCSDNDCPCSVTQIQHGSGYLYISPEVVKFRKNALSQSDCRKKVARFTEKNDFLSLQQYEPILICEKGAKRRNLDLNVAAKDARVWWEAQKAPLRATPFAVKTSVADSSVDAAFQKRKKPVMKQRKKPHAESENDYLHNSIKSNFHDSQDHTFFKETTHYSKPTQNNESSVDVVSQFAGTPLEELALKMNENSHTSYSKNDYSTTDTSIPYKSHTDTFHQYDKSLMQPELYGQRKKRHRKPVNFRKIFSISIPIVLSLLLISSLSFIIIKFPYIKAYIVKKFNNPPMLVGKEEAREEKPEKFEITMDFFNHFYSFKDNRYHGTIKFRNVTNESGLYEQDVFVFGKENKFRVTGSFVYSKEKIVFRPNGKNKDVIWMLKSLHLDVGTAFFYDPIKIQGEDAEISLQVKELPADEIVISTDPSEATVLFNDSILGQTPFSLKNPSFLGIYEFTIEKEGYSTEKYVLEFTGGISEKHLELRGISDSSRQENSTDAEAEKSTDSLVSDVSMAESAVSEEVSEESVSKQDEAIATIFLSSLPPVADIYMDGVRIGTTNTDDCQVTPGTHTMKFVKGSRELVKKMTFTAGRNPSQLVHLD